MRLFVSICFALLITPVYAADTYVVSTQVYFSPNGGAQDAVVKEIGNAKNLLVIRSSQLADLYFGNWAEHQKHYVVYQGRDRLVV